MLGTSSASDGGDWRRCGVGHEGADEELNDVIKAHVIVK